jgi:hypothetical protein
VKKSGAAGDTEKPESIGASDAILARAPGDERSVTLTERFFAIFGFIQVVGILATWRLEFLAVYVLLLVSLAVVIRFDVVNLLRPGDVRLKLRPPLSPSLSQTVQFELSVEPAGSRALKQSRIRLLALPTELFRFTESSLSWFPALRPAGTNVTFEAERARRARGCAVAHDLERAGL